MKARPAPASRQRGVAALTVAVLLLAVMAGVVLFAQRALLFEQKSSANQYRSTRAFELAEAGIEWAQAMLAEARPVDAACRVAAAGTSFRDRYLPSDARPAFVPPPGARAACRVSAGRLTCACPPPGEAPAPGGTSDEPGFGVVFAALAGDGDAVLVTAWGCLGQTGECLAGNAPAGTDAVARNAAVLKLRPLLRARPAAAITAGGDVLAAGAALTNLDRATQGALAVAGGTIAAASTALETLPGSPAVNALYPGDATLAGQIAQDADGVYRAFFGMDAARLRALPAVRAASGATPADRGAALRAAYAEGHRAFFADADVLLDASGLGTPADPVLLVGSAGVACAAPCVVHGLIVGDVAQRAANDLAGIDLRGAVVTRGHHAQAADSRVAYDPAVLAALQRRSAVFARLPGSWRDF